MTTAATKIKVKIRCRSEWWRHQEETITIEGYSIHEIIAKALSIEWDAARKFILGWDIEYNNGEFYTSRPLTLESLNSVSSRYPLIPGQLTKQVRD